MVELSALLTYAAIALVAIAAVIVAWIKRSKTEPSDLGRTALAMSATLLAFLLVSLRIDFAGYWLVSGTLITAASLSGSASDEGMASSSVAKQ